MSKKINISVSWPQAAKVYIALLLDGDSEGKKEAREGIMKMSQLAQAYADSVEQNCIVPVNDLKNP